MNSQVSWKQGLPSLQKLGEERSVPMRSASQYPNHLATVLSSRKKMFPRLFVVKKNLLRSNLVFAPLCQAEVPIPAAMLSRRSCCFRFETRCLFLRLELRQASPRGTHSVQRTIAGTLATGPYCASV